MMKAVPELLFKLGISKLQQSRSIMKIRLKHSRC